MLLKRKAILYFLSRHYKLSSITKIKETAKIESINFALAIINANLIFQSITLFSIVSYSLPYL